VKESIREKLRTLTERYEEIAHLLSEPDIIADNNRFRDLSKEYSQLEPVVRDFEAFLKLEADVDAARELIRSDDEDMRALGAEELESLESQLEDREQALLIHLIPKNPDDDSNLFLEIRAGTGGDEAALFAGDLFRMYSRYAEKHGWKVEILSESEGEQGGYKEIISRVVGPGAFSRLKFESGTHRVQRVPQTEAQGRIHTSACTVAVMPEVDEVIDIEISKADLREDTYRASGAGGQHVNKTDSAVRLTHLPTGIVVECQDERSQHKNRARAMSLLQAKLKDAEETKRREETAARRKSIVGSGDRSEKIRTYNFPQSRLTDHRIGFESRKLDSILEGGIDDLIEALTREHQAELLAEIGVGG
jgi:peptide chain release factor 1